MVHKITLKVKRRLEDFDMPRISKTRQAVMAKMMKESIYEAAATVLCKYGVNGTTMNRVAEAAKLTKSNLYYYFKDKDELLGYFNTRIVEPCHDAIKNVVDSNQSALEKLEKILRTCRTYAGEHKEILRLFAGAEQSEQIRRDNRPRFLQFLRVVFEQGIQQGTFRPHDCEFTARMLLGGIGELFELQIEGASDDVVDRYVEVLVDALYHGFSINIENADSSDGAGH
jgi:AcrR family transcriptional regulator